MNLSEENTKELESYGVWVKNTSKENSNSSESANDKNDNSDASRNFSNNNDELDLPDFDSTDFSDMFKDDSQFTTGDSQNDDFTSGLDSTLSTDELSNITDFADLTIENSTTSSDSEEISDEINLDDNIDEETVVSDDIFSKPIDDNDTIDFDDISQESNDLNSDISYDNSDPDLNIIDEDSEAKEDSEISFDTEEEISLDDFMDEGFSDESVAAGNNGYEPGKEKSPTPFTPNPESSETEELSLDDFMDGDFETEPEDVSAPKEDIIEDEPPLEMDLTFDDSVENVETEDNISVETYDDFDDDSVAIETEEISLDDFGTVFDTPSEDKQEAKPQASVNMSDTEEIDLSDFGIDANAEETPINQDVEEAKKKDTVVDYDLFVGDENTTSAPVVNEIKSAEKTESTEQLSQHENDNTVSENQNTIQTVSSVDTSILQQIMAELQNLKNDINTLKNNIEEIKAEESVKSVKEQEEIVIPQEEKKNEGGFFSDLDDDDTIALSFDELDNIMNNADFSSAKNNTEENLPHESQNEESFADEEILENETSAEEETLTSQEPVLEQTPAVEESFADEEILENDTPVEEETLENIIYDGQSEDEINFDFEDESLEEPTIESFSEISIDESFEDDLPEEISISKEDDIFVESNSQDFMKTESEETIKESDFEETEEFEEPFETVDSFEENEIDDDIPTVEKLLENQDTDSILRSDKAAFERDQLNQQNEVLVENIQSENQPEQENIENDFIELANSDILDQEPVIEETSVDIESDENNIQSVSEDEPVFDTFENISSEDEQDTFEVDFDSLSEQIIEEPVIEEQNEPNSENSLIDNNSDSLIENSENNSNENNDISKQTKEETAVTDTVQTQKPLSQDLMQDVKSLLLYMDQLLEDLPEEKIEEFANSDKFVLFKNVFEKLGLN